MYWRIGWTAVCFLAVLVCNNQASAALTSILDAVDRHDEPNLLGVNPHPGNPTVSVLEFLYGEGNLRRVDDASDTLFRYTAPTATVRMVAKFSGVTERFGYRQADGSLQTILQARDRRGSGYFPATFGAVGMLDPAETGAIVTLGMRDLAAFSQPNLNRTGADQLVTFEIVDAVGHPQNAIGSYVLAFEDTPPNFGSLTYDGDFQDLVVEVSGVVPIPEPTSTALLVALAVVSRSLTRFGTTMRGR
jgi:hypothetical protein